MSKKPLWFMLWDLNHPFWKADLTIVFIYVLIIFLLVFPFLARWLMAISGGEVFSLCFLNENDDV